MKALVPSLSLWMPVTKVGLTIAMATGLAAVQAATDAPVPAPTGAAAQGAAAKPGTAGKHRHKEVTLAPVRPEHYPSNPLPPVPTPKQKP